MERARDYRNASDAEKFRERLAPEVQKEDLEFGYSFLEDVRQVCPGYGPTAPGYDRELCLESSPIRVVTLNYKKTAY